MALWLSSFLPMSLSCVALAVSIWSFIRVRKLLRGASVRSLAQLSSEVAELMSACESSSAQVRKLAARVGMREVRERRREAGEIDEVSASVADKAVDRAKLKEIARARGLIK